jgi:SAM-dependent methyltransferase
VLRGGASEAEGMPPYLPFLEALGQHIRAATPDEVCAQTGAMASVLATILPELSLRLGELQSSYPLPPEQARLRLYEAVGIFLAAIAAPHGLLLLLDDLQWADTATLDLLCYVARSQPNARLLVLGAYREGEITHRLSFERALTELNRLRQLTTITPGSLTEADLSTFTTNALGAPVDTALSRLLATQSEGNPFFAEEVLWGWLETGVITHDEEGVRLGEPVEATLPSSIASAVRQRVNRLAPQVITLLHTAAIIGRTFDIALLAGVADQDSEAVEEHLRQAEQARLIRSEQPGMFTFSHDTIRACLYDEVSSSRRTRLHTLIGRRLELRLDHSDAHQLAEIAFHFARSGDRELGATYSQLAAEQARYAYAPQEAVGHYRTALLLVADHDLRRREWLQGLGEAALLAATPLNAIGAFQAALDWWLAAGNSGAAGRAALGLGRAHWRLEEIGPARAALQQAVTLLSEQPTTDTVLREGQAALARAMYHNLLGNVWLPMIPEVHARLQADPPARVVDISCGYGWSSLALARVYPKVHVDGFDSDEDSITAASTAAAEAGLANRVSFAVRDATDLGLVGTYDLVLVCNAIHDLARPVEAMQVMRGLVAAGGTVIAIEPRAPETFSAPSDLFDQMHYLESLLFSLPAGMAEQPSAATGRVMRPATLRRYAMEASFRGVEILPIEHPCMRMYRLFP